MSVGRTWSEAGFPKETQSSSSSPSSSSIAWDHVSSPQLAAVRTLYSWTYYLINSEKTEDFVCSVLKQMQSVSAGRCTFFSLSLCRFTQPVERLLWGADCTVMFVGHKSLTRARSWRPTSATPWFGRLFVGRLSSRFFEYFHYFVCFLSLCELQFFTNTTGEAELSQR